MADAVRRLGGLAKAAAAGQTTVQTVLKARRDGRVRRGDTVLLWAEALEPTRLKARWALARRLAGIE